jgi:hypothetical protein
VRLTRKSPALADVDIDTTGAEKFLFCLNHGAANLSVEFSDLPKPARGFESDCVSRF